MAKRSKRGRNPAGNLRQYDTAALVAERDRRMAELREQRGEALAVLEGIDRAIADLGGAAESRPSGARAGKKAGRKKSAGDGRSHGGMSLADAIAAVLSSGGPTSVTDLAGAVRTVGYPSSSPNLRSMVQQRLVKDRRFKRVSRGVYALK